MNSPSLYIEISQSSFKLLNGKERFEFSLDRLQNGRLTEACTEKLTASLQDFVKKKNWQARLPTWCAIGARGVSLRRLTLPVSNKEELRRLLRLQIESEFPLSPEQLAWGYQPLYQNGSRQQEILVVAVKKELIEDYSEILSACGMNPVFTVAAMARAGHCSQPPQSYAVLDIGRSHSELLSFENGAPGSICILPWGGESVTGTIQEKLGVSHDEAEKLKLRSENDLDGELASKVGRAVEASLETLAGCIRSKWSGQKLYLSGRSVRQKDFATRLANYFGAGAKCEVIEIPEESLSAAIAGLKKSNETPGSPPLVVLQLNETKNGERTVAYSQPRKWAALAAALAVILLFLPYAEAILLKSRTAKKLSAAQAESGRLAVIDR
ncbi:MAG: pilus assembly protein PilM [Verrucomicrobiota bacterium]